MFGRGELGLHQNLLEVNLIVLCTDARNAASNNPLKHELQIRNLDFILSPSENSSVVVPASSLSEAFTTLQQKLSLDEESPNNGKSTTAS